MPCVPRSQSKAYDTGVKFVRSVTDMLRVGSSE